MKVGKKIGEEDPREIWKVKCNEPSGVQERKRKGLFT